MAKRTETTFWSLIQSKMSPYWAAQRHEDKHTKGIPDVSYSMNGVNGWIELKTVEVSNAGKVNIPHFTTEQRQWLKRHGRRGGHCFLFVEITNSKQFWSSLYVLIPYDKIDTVSGLAWEEMVQLSSYHSFDGVDLARLIDALL